MARWIAAMTLFALLGGCNGSEEGGGAPRTDGGPVIEDGGVTLEDLAGEDTGEEALEEAILAEMANMKAPGLGAAIITGGEVQWTSAYGQANIEQERDITEDTMFLLASVSKTYTVTALMQLWEEGLFHLDDDVGDYLGFPVRSPYHPDVVITFRHLMAHASSIKDNWNVMEAEFYTTGSDSYQWSLEEIVAEYLPEEGELYREANWFRVAPGTLSEYSNIGTVVLGRLVEVLAGQPFDAYCEENIFAPLGLEHTTWRIDGWDHDASFAMPYTNSRQEYHPTGHYTFADYPDGGLRSSTRDVARFLATYARGGEIDGVRILNESTLEEMFTVQFPSLDDAQGLIWYKWNYQGAEWVGHNGGETGVATDMGFRMDDGAGFVVLTNGDSWDHGDEWGMEDVEDMLIDMFDDFD